MNSTVLTATVQPSHGGNYIGMDVHSDNVVACVRRNDFKNGQLRGKTIALKKFSIRDSKEPLTNFLSKYADGQQHIMTAESTFNWYWLADIAEDHGWNFRLADPCTVSQANIKAANDETDAEYLAERLRMGSLKSTAVLPRALRGVRDLMRHRMHIMQEVADKKVRLSNLYHNHCAHPMSGKLLAELQDAYVKLSVDAVLASGICNNGSELIIADLLTGLRDAQNRLETIEAAVYARIDEVDAYKSERLLLKSSMKGCGDVLSAIIVTEIGDISRFRTMGDFVSYCRLAPTSKLSNGKSKGQGNAKNGNAYLSWALTELATLMARYNPPIAKYLDRKLGKSKLRVIAIRALAAKLARSVYQVLRKKEPFDVGLTFTGTPTRLPPAPPEATVPDIAAAAPAVVEPVEAKPQQTARASNAVPAIAPVTAMTATAAAEDDAPIEVKEPVWPAAAKRVTRKKAAARADQQPAATGEGKRPACVASRVKAPCALTATKPAYAGTSCVKSRRE